MIRRLSVWLLVLAPAIAFAASKETQELQRDVAQLQDQVRQLQQSQDRQLAALTTLVQQSVDAANRANTAVAVIQSNLQQNLKDQESKVGPMLVGVSSRLDSLSSDSRTTQQAVSDLTSLLSKLQAQMTDIVNLLKVMQAPAPPPPGSSTPPGQAMGGPVSGAAGSSEAPSIGASDLYANATRDRSSGKLDLALQEFSDYLKYYGNTELAPNAQFYIGMIHFSQSEFEAASQDFDMVLEKYSKNPKTEDALYYKGMSLLRVPGHKTQAGDEFKELIKEFPGTDRAKEACTQLTNLGYNTCRFPASATKRGKKK